MKNWLIKYWSDSVEENLRKFYLSNYDQEVALDFMCSGVSIKVVKSPLVSGSLLYI